MAAARPGPGVTLVSPRRYAGVVPMGSAPHGNHTGSAPYPHEHNAVEPPEAASGTNTERNAKSNHRSAAREDGPAQGNRESPLRNDSKNGA